MALLDFLGTSNTFRQWLATTNNLISTISNTSVFVLVSQNATPDTTTGNVSINGTMTIATVTANGTITANVFSGNGVSLTSLNASALATGTVPDARLSGTYTGITANNATYAFGKSEGALNVNSATTATTANNSTYAFGKTEGNLNVNSAVYLTDKLPLSNVSIHTVGNVTNITTAQDWFHLQWSPGLVSGGTLTDNGNGSVTLANGEVSLRVDAVDHANLAVYFVSGGVLSLTNNDVNYIYANYNGGSPTYSVTTTFADINEYTHTLLYVIGRRGTELTGIDASSQNVSLGSKIDGVLMRTDGYVYKEYSHVTGGSVIGTPSAAYLSLTAGEFYYGLSSVTHPAFDTSVAGTAAANVFRYYYNRSAWTFTTNAKSISNTQYDNAGTLTSLSNKNYRTDYVYLVPNGLVGTPYLAVVYGNTQYTSYAAAAAAPLPASLPPEMDGLAVLVGQVIAQESQATITVQSFATSLIASAVSSHNSLAGLQGGATNEYYHLSSNGYTALSVLNTSAAPAAGALLIGNGSALTVNTLTNGTNIVITNGSGAITIAADANVLSTTSTTGINASALSTGTVPDGRLSGTYTNITANNATYAFGKLEGALNVNNALTANQSTYLAGAAVTGNSTALTVGANVYVSQSTVFVGNTTANSVLTSTSFAVANSTNTATLTPISLTIGTQVANTVGFYAGANVYANTSTVFFGNSTVNSVHTATSLSVANSTNTATLTPISLTIGTQVANTVGFYAGANVYANTTTVFLGNSTVNAVTTSAQFAVANSTNTATLTPISLTIGTQIANTTGLYAGANVYANTTTVFFGNSTVNSVHTATSLSVANSTNTATLTPISLTIGTQVANTVGFYAGANVYANTTTVFVGNSTANVSHTATSIAVANSTNTATLTSTSLTIGGTIANTTAFVVPATSKIYLDGGGDTYIIESSANVLDAYAGGVNALRMNTSGLTITGNTLPSANATYNLGSTTMRWSTVYTADLDLKNDIGDWTIVEGADDLFIYNNKRGKVYKFNLVEVDPTVAPPKKV